jgi:hypothetical protein
MATTKKGTAGKQAASGARRGTTKANGVAKETKSKSTANGATASKQAAPVKLNDWQRDFLKKIKDAGETGYTLAQKAEQRTIDALIERKLVKRGAKNKETGQQRFLLTKAAEKHLPPPAAEPVPVLAAEPAPTEPPTTA